MGVGRDSLFVGGVTVVWCVVLCDRNHAGSADW